MRLLISLLTISLLFLGCHGSHAKVEGLALNEDSDDCSSLGNFKSYDEAISKVKDTKFKLSESVDPDKSSWIRVLLIIAVTGKRAI